MLNSQMAVNLLGLAILAEQSSQCPHPSHPDYLLRESGIRCTFPFTIAWIGMEGRGVWQGKGRQRKEREEREIKGRGRGGRGRSEGRKRNEGERVKRQHTQPYSSTLIAILQ